MRTLILSTIVLAGLAPAASVRAADPAPATAPSTAGPQELMEGVSQALLGELEKNREALRQDPAALRAVVDRHLLPYFDTDYAGQLVLGKHWRQASAAQRKRFVDAFYQSLMRNYGEALLDFTADRMKILPFKGDPNATSATVRTEVRRDNGTLVPVNYSLRKTPSGWKAWDVTIEGISYVKNYRNDIGAEVAQKGLDAVIQRLEAQNAAGNPPKPAEKPAASAS
jgi:phospholipid transport system substrate-binding protein